MMVKSGLEKIISKFHEPLLELLLPSAKEICPKRLKWQGRLTGISQKARGFSK